MKLLGTLIAVVIMTVAAAGSLSAQFSGQGISGTFSTQGGRSDAWFIEADFGATAHTENWTISLTCDTETGFVVWWYNIPVLSTATNETEWNGGIGIYDTQNLTATGSTTNHIFTTPSLSGTHRFVFYVVTLDQYGLTSPVFPMNISVDIDNGTNTATATTDGGATNGWEEYNSSSGTPTTWNQTGASGNSDVTAINWPNTIRSWTVLGAAGDRVAYQWEVDHGTTSAALDIGFYSTYNGTGTGGGTTDVELYDMTLDGGASPVVTIQPGGTVSAATEDANSYQTPARTGSHTYRIVLTGGTGFNGAPETYMQVAWGLTPSFSAGVQPFDYPSPVTITPGGSAISTSTTLTASGGSGTPSYTWAIQGTPPTGWSLSATTGTSVTLQAGSGSGTVTVRVTNGSTGEWAEETYTVTGGGGGGALTITGPGSLPNGVESVVYTNTTFTASGGTPAYTWSATGLPTGLTLSTGGVLSGTPGAGTSGSSPYSVDVTVTDSTMATDTANYSLVINAAGTLTITTTSLPAGTEGSTYGPITINAVGGTTPYSWSATGLPSGLSIDAGTGAISGTPAAGTATGSPYSVTVTVTDSAGTPATDNQVYSLTINAASSGGGTVGGGGGGGGGGGCVAATESAPWLLLIALLGLVAVGARLRKDEA